MRQKYTLLFLIILLSFGLRTWGIAQRGIIGRDEAWHVYSARGLQMRLQTSANLESSQFPNETRPSFERISSNNVAGKPTYVFLIWLLGCIRGQWDYESTLALSIISGTASMAAIYWLARRSGQGEMGALFSAGLAAVSFLNVYFSRIAYPHAALILMNTCALGLYLLASPPKSSNWILYLAGILWGIGLALHMSLVLFLPGILFAEIYRQHVFQQSFRQVLLRLFVVGAGIVIVQLGWELAYFLGRHFLPAGNGLVSLSGSYIGDVFGHSQTGSLPTYGIIMQLLFYPLALVGQENFMVALLVFVGFASIVRSAIAAKHPEAVYLAIFFISHFGFLLLFPAKYGRQLAPLLSIWPILASWGFFTITGFFAQKNRFFLPRIVFILALSLIAFNLYWLWPELSSKPSGWKQAAAWLRVTDPNGLSFVREISDTAILNYYLPGQVLYINQVEKLAGVSAPVHWYVMGPTDNDNPEWMASAASILTGKQPKAIFFDYWETLRPHRTVSGNWSLVPWWRWISSPASLRPGFNDSARVYRLVEDGE